jgi:hypothetical protein
MNAHITKADAPAATNAFVRVPAIRCLHCRSNPTTAPINRAAPSLREKSSICISKPQLNTQSDRE